MAAVTGGGAHVPVSSVTPYLEATSPHLSKIESQPYTSAATWTPPSIPSDIYEAMPIGNYLLETRPSSIISTIEALKQLS